MSTDMETQHTSIGRLDSTEEKPTTSDPNWVNLRRVPDNLPKIALLILAVEVRTSVA
jgi:proton-dependent oligopeptide transporter, POT family